jgi:hypothetical protein
MALAYDIIYRYHYTRMSSKHERTLREVFSEPTKANIEWDSIERMLRHPRRAR